MRLPKTISNLIYFIKFSWRISKRRFAASAITIILDTLEPFVYLIAPMLIINALLDGGQWNDVLALVGMFTGFVAFFKVVRLSLLTFLNMSINSCDVKTAAFYHFQYLHMSYVNLEDNRIRDMQVPLYHRVHPNFCLQGLTLFITSILRLAGLSYIIITLHPGILVFMFLFVAITYLMKNKSQKNEYSFQPVKGRANRFFTYILDTMMFKFDYAKEVRVNRVSDMLSNKYDSKLNQFSGENKKYLRKLLGLNTLNAVMEFLQTVMMYGYVVYMALYGHITVGALSMYIGAIRDLSNAFNDIASSIATLKWHSAYIDDYKEYISLVDESLITNAGALNDLPEKNAMDENVLFEFKNVGFCYPNTSRKVLDNISLVMKKNEKLSIVGLNGAGKTTFIKLLCRLYQPTEGAIFYKGVNINTIKKKEYLELLSVVFQDWVLFSFSFAQNITLNRPFEVEKLYHAIDQAGLKERLDKMPRGIHTSIFKDFDEQGIELSGGEGQKLVTARAYYKDAPLVILDEPTAALDAQSEHMMYRNFNEIIGEKAAVFISHRLASTRFCDKIAVFCDGAIVEYGKHEELLNNKKLYYEMFEKQARHYKEASAKVGAL